MTMTPTAQLLEDAVAALVGLECWGVVAGAGTGSRVALDFGAKFLRDSPAKNEHLTHDQRTYEAAYSLFVQASAWRIQTSTAVIGSWYDYEDSDRLVAALEQLRGAQIVAAAVTPPAWDVTLTFDNGMTLLVLSSITPGMDMDDYTVFTPRLSVTVGGGGQLSVEPRMLDRAGQEALAREAAAAGGTNEGPRAGHG